MKAPQIIYYTSILFVFVLLNGCSSTTDKQISPKPLFPDRYGWDLKQIAMSDTKQNVLEFNRVDCVWVVGNEKKPSDEQKVSALADKLVRVLPEGLVTKSNDRYRDFKVGDAIYSRKIVLTFKDKSSFTMLLGVPALTKPVYVRLEGKKEVYRVDEPMLKQLDLNSLTWITHEES